MSGMLALRTFGTKGESFAEQTELKE